MPYLSVEAIENGLRSHVRSLVYAIAKNKPVLGSNDGFRIGSKQSLSVRRDGCWYSFEEGVGGKTLVGLVCHANDISFREALLWAEEFLASNDVVVTASASKSLRDNSRQYAVPIWNQAQKLSGTLGEVYLHDIRGIPRINTYARSRIRFCQKLKHPDGNRYPALLFKVQAANEAFAGLLRIYLDRNSGTKIPNQPKLCLGNIKGAAIRFAPVREELIVCEGAEDALSLLYACENRSVWCGIGGGLRSIIIPPQIRRVTIAADNDTEGVRIAQDLAQRLLDEGRSVFIAKPPKVKDFNELFTRK